MISPLSAQDKSAIFGPGDQVELRVERRLGESAQRDKWIFCLTAAMVATNQESK